ncbi:unnamed protein product [Timema podura]|uniref:Uncharacterized protein n=1 Tax=Timema podura TaxID=61482 RepID=A0ABN7PGA0_TIMPD|nr:unnamed protein product [Timema podura]
MGVLRQSSVDQDLNPALLKYVDSNKNDNATPKGFNTCISSITSLTKKCCSTF